MNSSKSTYFQFRYFIVVSLLVAGLGALSVNYACRQAEEREVQSITTRVQTIAASLQYFNLYSLTGTPSDVFNLDYVLIKQSLGGIKEANEDVRFVYLMAPSIYPDKLLFLVDNEPEDSEDISLPGDIYNETTQEELQGFKDAIPFIEGPYTDEWGTWISAFAPLIDRNTGQVIALVGIDISAEHWFEVINNAKIVPIIVTLSVLVLLLLIYLFERKIDKIRAEMISITSHQLSTPLTGIKWYAEALSDGDMGALNPKQADYVKQISASAERLIHLIKNLLNIAKIERGEKLEIVKEEVNISEIIDIILKDLVELTKSNNIRAYKAESFPAKAILKVDKEKIQQVFQNLISNAIKYSKPGGEVVISFETNGNFDIFSVKDSGLGIPKADQPKIFNKFFRGSNVGSNDLKGTGLGLYLVQMIVKKHKGELNFSSEEGKGSIFSVCLPVK